MRVICPNCEQRGLIDAAAPSDAPVRTLCPRCGTPFRAILLDEQAPRDLHTVITVPATAPHVAAMSNLEQDAPADAPDAAEDVLSLPQAESHGEMLAVPACRVLDFDEELAPPRHARTRADDDKYRIATRLLNASPLWLLVAGCAFIVLAVLCDRLLTPDDPARADVATIASLENQATNRDASRRHARDDSQKDEAQGIGDAETQARAAVDSAETKPAPISDAVASPSDSAAHAVAVSFASARQELTDDAHDVAQLPTKLTLQLASYRLEAEAQKLAARLQASGFEARIAVQQKSKRPWYCVQTGSFERREDAEQYLAGLRAKNFAESYTLREVD
ncbi:MAG: hypothetical protein QOF61_2887 [Acidobacteriota bacterium]|nr:hypothetical protein [Acidobacteriota bacterium]